MGIFEILLFLIIALIVIPPDDLPQVMRAVGKVLRELRLASNTVMREISGAIGDDSPFNILPPRFDDPHPPSVPPASSPAPAGFLASEPQSQLPAEVASPAQAELELRASPSLAPPASLASEPQSQPPTEVASPAQAEPEPRASAVDPQATPKQGSMPPVDKP